MLMAARLVYKAVELATAMRCEIAGPSMEPALLRGDYVLISRLAYLWREPKPGDVVVAKDPDVADRLIIKRIVHITADYRFVLRGDNEGQSRDSREFGAVARDAILGKAWVRYWPPRRIGTVPRRIVVT
ncbi:MAG TPA: signal peptidase I [Dehalococcoidia bacterium]|nr:signal peptidase I [Dehalococcoidia bacterium]